MQNLIIILTFIYSIPVIGQTFRNDKEIISSIKEIDSLFREIKLPLFSSLKINYERELILLYNFPTDSTLKTTDTIEIDYNEKIDLVKYCRATRIDFQLCYKIIELLKMNQLQGIEQVGPGDCADCSNYIFWNQNHGYVVKKIDNRCFPDDCFYGLEYGLENELKKQKHKRISENIILITAK
jgi:hypothetical protein